MAPLVEFDVSQQATGHGEDQSGIQQNQAGLADVGIVEQNEPSSDNTGRQTVAGLPHDQVCSGDGQSTEKSR